MNVPAIKESDIALLCTGIIMDYLGTSLIIGIQLDPAPILLSVITVG